MKVTAISALWLLILVWPVQGQSTADAPAPVTDDGTVSEAPADGEQPAEGPTDEERRASGRALILEVIKAHGGDAFIDQASQVAKGTGRLRPMGQATSTDLEYLRVYKRFPLEDRIEMKMPHGEVIQVFDGTKGWILNAGQLADQTATLKNRRYYGYDVLRRFDDSFRAKQLDDEVVEDRTYAVVRIKDREGRGTTVYIDPNSHRVFQVVYSLDPREVTERYTEYREIKGVWIPFRIELYQGAAKVLEFYVAGVEVNVELEDGLFSKPSLPSDE